MTLYETIFKRRAVRKFDQNPISGDVLTKIKTRLSEIKQLDGQKAKFEIVSSLEIGVDKAPHYILAFCEKKADAYINIGYCLEEMDLFIQSMNLGSLWLGMAKPKEKEEDFAIMLAFGKTDIPLREKELDFNRLNLDKISSADNSVSRAARLAPSAMNSQPWKFRFEDRKVLIDYCGRGLLKVILKKKLSKIDIGIVTKFIELALINERKEIKSIIPEIFKDNFGVCVSYN